MGPARRLLRLPRALPPLQRGPGTAGSGAGSGARPRPPRLRVCGTWKGQGLDSGPVEGTRRPENGSLSTGVMWEPPTGEASISLSPVFCLTPAVCPPPPQVAALSGVAQVFFALRETVSGEGHSGQWGFTWDIKGPSLFGGMGLGKAELFLLAYRDLTQCVVGGISGC